MTKTVPNSVKKYTGLSFCIAASIAVSACGNARETRGYYFDTELADAIAPGVDNRQSVNSTLGSPTIPALFSDNTWYYVSSSMRVRPIFWPETTQHRVMAIHFNESGVVANVENFDLSDTQPVSPVGDKTPTKGRHLSFFQSVFGTVGTFSGQQGRGGNNGNNGNPTGPNG